MPSPEKMQGPVGFAKDVNQNLRNLIKKNFGEKFNGFLATRDETEYLSVEEKENVLLSLAMRQTVAEITKSLNMKRVAEGKKPVEYASISYYRQKYADLIDDIYAEAFINIGEVYPMSDKVVRISKLNELAEAMFNHTINEVTSGLMDDFTMKKGNFLIKIMDRINEETGNMPMSKMIKRVERDQDEKPEQLASKDEIKTRMLEDVKSRFSAQLPARSENDASFSDYTVCFNAEKHSETTCCNLFSINGGAPNIQCEVQSGKTKVCKKWIDKRLMNKDYLSSYRSNQFTITDISIAVGCKEPDSETKAVIRNYMMGLGIAGYYDNKKIGTYIDGEYKELWKLTDEQSTKTA